MKKQNNKKVFSEVFFLDYFNSLIEGDKAHCAEIVSELFSKRVDIKDIYTDLYQRSLYRIGKLWDEGKLSVAEEHSATQITLHLINTVLPKHSKKTKGKRVLISCIDKEYHEIGAKMVANIFEFNGWDTRFLGASVPAKDIVKFIKVNKPEFIGLSFNLYLNLVRLFTVIEHIKKFFPDQKIIIGGQAAKQERKSILAQFPDLLYFDSLHELDKFIKLNSK